VRRQQLTLRSSFPRIRGSVDGESGGKLDEPEEDGSGTRGELAIRFLCFSFRRPAATRLSRRCFPRRNASHWEINTGFIKRINGAPPRASDSIHYAAGVASRCRLPRNRAVDKTKGLAIGARTVPLMLRRLPFLLPLRDNPRRWR